MTSFKQRFRDLLTDPSGITEKDLTQLEELRSAYPWFQAIYPLIAAYHKKGELYSFQRHLKLASLYAGNREILREFLSFHTAGEIEKTEDLKPSVDDPAVQDQDAQRTEIVDAAKDKKEDPETTAEPLNVHAARDAKQIEKAEPETQQASEEIHDKTSKEEPPTTDVQDDIAKEAEKDPVERQNRKDKVEFDSLEKEENDYPILYDPLTELKKLMPEFKAESESKPSHSMTFQPVYDPEKELSAYLETEDEPEENPEPHDFLYWLDHAGEDPEKNNHKPADRIKDKLKEESTDVKDLLDSFIHNRPKISRPKAEFFRAEKAAKKSELDESDIVSESLAKLHLKQGHFQKAIEVYEKLILQNPHRKAYFAALIKEVKENKL